MHSFYDDHIKSDASRAGALEAAEKVLNNFLPGLIVSSLELVNTLI